MYKLLITTLGGLGGLRPARQLYKVACQLFAVHDS